MRGFFAVGVEGGSKVGNLGNLMRSAHGFGASFVFTVAGEHFTKGQKFSDPSETPKQVPLYQFKTSEDLMLPRLCSLVGVELIDAAGDLPSFCHPKQAAYVLGPERGSLSEGMLARCDHVVKIPTQFALNVATAGAIVMYDRVRVLGRWAARPVSPFSEPDALPAHHFGKHVSRRETRR